MRELSFYRPPQPLRKKQSASSFVSIHLKKILFKSENNILLLDAEMHS